MLAYALLVVRLSATEAAVRVTDDGILSLKSRSSRLPVIIKLMNEIRHTRRTGDRTMFELPRNIAQIMTNVTGLYRNYTVRCFEVTLAQSSPHGFVFYQTLFFYKYFPSQSSEQRCNNSRNSTKVCGSRFQMVLCARQGHITSIGHIVNN